MRRFTLRISCAMLPVAGAFCLASFAAFCVFPISVAAVTVSQPIVQSNVFSFFFDSEAGRLFTVQCASSLASEWSDVAHYPGTGRPIDFSSAVLVEGRFFRVRSTTLGALELDPNTPVLPTGSISLPDVIVGGPYSEQVSAAFTGVPPYTMQVSGSPPDGVSLVITSNMTAHASVQIASSGSGLVANQLRQFAVTVVDSLNSTNTRNYDLRVVAASPGIALDTVLLKAGEASSIKFTANGGSEPLSWSVVSGALPPGMTLSANGLLTGTPTSDAAEMNEDGKYTNVIEVADSFTDRISGALSSRKTTKTVKVLVRLSYLLNIRATRENGPSLRQTCLACHGPGFQPDFEAPSALALVNVNSGSGAECGTERVYVSPGDASDSLVYEKLTDRWPCGDRMPQGGPYLSDRSRERLARWIRELTPADAD